MKRYIPFGLAAILTVGMASSAWSQASQSGGAGTAGAPGTSGAAGTAGTPGTASPANTPGAAGTAAVGAPSVPQNVNIGANPQSQGAGANPQSVGVGANPQSVGVGANPPTRAGFGGNIQQTPFFTDPGVRRQLNMNENQFNTLNRAYRNAYGRYNRNLAGLTNNLTLQQRQLQMQAYANQFYDDFGKTVDTTFTDPRYRTRYDQLNWQHMGFNAFNNPMIQRQFNLTPQQTVQIRQLASAWREQLDRMRRQNGNASINNNIDPQQWAALNNQYWDQINSVLTPEQQQMWTQLTGQRYNFPPNAFLDGDAQGQSSDGATPVNRRGEATGPERFLLQGGGQAGQKPSNASPQPSQGTAPQGGTAAGTQGGAVR